VLLKQSITVPYCLPTLLALLTTSECLCVCGIAALGYHPRDMILGTWS